MAPPIRGVTRLPIAFLRTCAESIWNHGPHFLPYAMHMNLREGRREGGRVGRRAGGREEEGGLEGGQEGGEGKEESKIPLVYNHSCPRPHPITPRWHPPGHAAEGHTSPVPGVLCELQPV